jgi:hypothetical protein
VGTILGGKTSGGCIDDDDDDAVEADSMCRSDEGTLDNSI